MMDHGACNVIYVDRRAREELVRRDTQFATHASNDANQPEYFKAEDDQVPGEVRSNLESILLIFNEGMRYTQTLLDMPRILILT